MCIDLSRKNNLLSSKQKTGKEAKMNKGFVYLAAMMMCSGVSQAQVIDLGIAEQPIETAKEAEKTSLPNANTLPEIKDMRPKESTTAQPETPLPNEEKKEAGLFSFLNFWDKEGNKDNAIAQEAKVKQETYLEAITRKAEEGSVEAQLSLGYMYLYGDKENKVEPDYKKSFEYYSMAAAQNDKVAINNLGSLFYSGIGTKRNPYKAAQLFAKAAELGNSEAALNLAFLYISGSGVSKDNEKAIKYFSQSASQGNITAGFMLGYAYYRGFMVPQDYYKAVELIKPAVDAEFDEAEYIMAQMYLAGSGVMKNYVNAVKYFGLAANQGNVNAIVSLGDIYAQGEVYKKNLPQAHLLYNIASVRGSEIAAEKRDAIEKQLQIDVVLKAQASAEQYKETPSNFTVYVRRTFGENIFGYIEEQMPKEETVQEQKENSPSQSTASPSSSGTKLM